MLWTRVWTTCLLLARSTPLLLPPPLENKPATHPTQKDILKLAPAGTNTEAFTGFTASKGFDPDDDSLISTTEFRHTITHLGEKLTDAAADEMMIRAVDVDNESQINSDNWAKGIVEGMQLHTTSVTPPESQIADVMD